MINKETRFVQLDDWRNNIASKCVNNPLLMFAVSISFAGPLLGWMGFQTMGFHMMGHQAWEKHIIYCGGLRIYFRTWNTTAAEHSDSVLILDEINQADPLTVGQTIYQLGNEEGRARATDTGSSTRSQHKWRLMWISNGERSLQEIQTRAGKVTEAGMEMRLLHIRADLHTEQKERDSKGIYQDLHGFAHGAALSEYLKQEVAKSHGHPFIAYIKSLTELDQDKRKKMIDYVHRNIEGFQNSHLSESASGQARRAARAFAFVGECGEGNTEDTVILEQICLQLQTKGESHWV